MKLNLNFSTKEETMCEGDGRIACEFCGMTPCNAHVASVQ
jgi:hypothetical protein